MWCRGNELWKRRWSGHERNVARERLAGAHRCHDIRLPNIAYRYTIFLMIKTFASKDAQALFGGESVRRFTNIEKAARRKLELLEAATILDELRVPPGNRLEALKGDRKGQHSIRINDQFRVCFRWNDGHAYDVEICDYH
jgi:proteic killer suppression protein